MEFGRRRALVWRRSARTLALALIWAVALVGILLKLIAPRHVEPLSVPLYLIMGWAVLFNPGLLLACQRR